MVRGVLPVFISMKMRYSPGLLSMAFDEVLCLNQQVASEQCAPLFIQSSELDPSLSRLGSSPLSVVRRGDTPPSPRWSILPRDDFLRSDWWIEILYSERGTSESHSAVDQCMSVFKDGVA